MKFIVNFLVITITLLLAGCNSRVGEVVNDNNRYEKPLATLAALPTVQAVSLSVIDVGAESYESITIETDHYLIHTTASDRLLLRRLPMLLESAWVNYNEFVPVADGVELVKGQVYYFRNRDQWLAYTRANTGDSAEIFARIDSGAYCFEDKCVAWQISRNADFSVLAHEAWHQYCGLYMKSVLPSWLAESSAVYLESYKWDAKGLAFSPKYNLGRLASLKLSMQAGMGFSVRQLVGSDPGFIISKTDNMSPEQKQLYISGYYGRLYALGRFMFEYEYGIYRKGFESLLTDAMAGELALSPGLKNAEGTFSKSRAWSMHAGLELFENYIAEPSGELEKQYQDYCGKLAGSIRLRR